MKGMKRLLLVAAATFISGGVFKAERDDTSGTALWNTGDGDLWCGDEEMINKDNGGKAHVTLHDDRSAVARAAPPGLHSAAAASCRDRG
jgi:hypothetical protein